MTALVARLRPRWDAALARGAELAGKGIRGIGLSLPGIGGPLLIAYGFGLAWRPLGFIVAGGFLILLDRRTP